MEENKFLEILNKELVISLGCTEPIAIAFAAACSKKACKGKYSYEDKIECI